jgi:WhiB family transcriptional regulator, redox-sensing transcriptional regulator
MAVSCCLPVCRSRVVLPDLGFRPGPRGGGGSQGICAICRVRRECLTFALRTGQLHGIWGGTTEDERAAARRKTAGEQAATKEPRPA